MKIIISISILLSSLNVLSQSQIKESLTLKSKILNGEIKYSIYLPNGYSTSNRRYPVLYLLHGYTYDETSWIQFGNIQALVDRSIKDGDGSEMIIVMPDGGKTWYQNNLDATFNYEDFFINELIHHIDTAYRTRTKNQFRAIAGFSMGGWGALLLAMKHPGVFIASCSINGAVYTDKQLSEGSLDQTKFDEVFGDLYGKGLKGYDRINNLYKVNAPLHIVHNKSADELKKSRYYIDCADDDFLITGNMNLHAMLLEKGIPHEFRVRDGNHTWDYWRTGIPEVLKFVTQSFIN